MEERHSAPSPSCRERGCPFNLSTQMTTHPLLATLRRLRRALGRAGLARVVVGVWLAVHGFSVTAVPVADALAGHADEVVAHWEDAQDTSCPPQHDPATCQLCQQIGTSLSDGPASRVAPVAVVRGAGLPPRGEGTGACEASLRGAPDPRGPPTV